MSFILSVTNTECHFQAFYAECRNAECLGSPYSFTLANIFLQKHKPTHRYLTCYLPLVATSQTIEFLYQNALGSQDEDRCIHFCRKFCGCFHTETLFKCTLSFKRYIHSKLCCSSPCICSKSYLQGPML